MPAIYEQPMGRQWLDGAGSSMMLDAILQPRPAQYAIYSGSRSLEDGECACQRRTEVPCPCAWRSSFGWTGLLGVVTLRKHRCRADG